MHEVKEAIMRSKKLLRQIGVVGILPVVTATSVSLLVFSVYSQTASTTAFKASVVERNYRGVDRQDAVVREYQHAVRSDGSEADVFRSIAPDGRPALMRIVVDPNQLRRIVADGLTESTTTTHLSQEYAESFKTKPSSCGAEPQAERRTYLGYETLRISRSVKSGSASTIVVEQWLAPALNCYPLRETYLRPAEGRDPIVVTEREVTSVTPGEPDSSLFDIPSAYKERAPTAVFAEFARRYPNDHGACDEPCQRGRSRVDQSYYAQQRRGVQ
jgi:hypothetical protein